jgi:hypothetical protein
MRCVICRQGFDFDSGQTAVVLRHVAYGYDFAHPGACEQAALELLFPEAGYDSAAFSHDLERAYVLRTLGSSRLVLTQLRDGSHRIECVVRGPGRLGEPGGAEFVGDGVHLGELAA